MAGGFLLRFEYGPVRNYTVKNLFLVLINIFHIMLKTQNIMNGNAKSHTKSKFHIEIMWLNKVNILLLTNVSYL